MQQFTEGEIIQPKYSLEFNERSIRMAFVRKVFALVTIMFAIVAAMSSVGIISSGFRRWVQDNFWIYIVALIVFFVLSIVLSCFQTVRRSFPLNIILLGIFTIAAGAMCMFITAQYNVQSILLTLLITTVCCGGVVIFAIFVKKDLTSYIGVAYILGMVLLIFGITAIIFTAVAGWNFLYSVYAGLASLLFMFYLMIDVQMIMGGRQLEISPEEYIFAALQIFLDIFSIFLMLLGFIGSFGGRN